MKTKKFNKKLVLNKSTVADLDGRRMNEIKGGSAFCSLVKTQCLGATTGNQICHLTCGGCTSIMEPCLNTCKEC
jgi:hypothetical protein